MNAKSKKPRGDWLNQEAWAFSLLLADFCFGVKSPRQDVLASFTWTTPKWLEELCCLVGPLDASYVPGVVLSSLQKAA